MYRIDQYGAQKANASFRLPMALLPGTTLGPYQIDAPLGAGGMGEVYKGTDTRLDRTVAIKVLPECLRLFLRRHLCDLAGWDDCAVFRPDTVPITDV